MQKVRDTSHIGIAIGIVLKHPIEILDGLLCDNVREPAAAAAVSADEANERQ
jgi:hypothetical protein